jgi:hypothetical protein
VGTRTKAIDRFPSSRLNTGVSFFMFGVGFCETLALKTPISGIFVAYEDYLGTPCFAPKEIRQE